MPTPRDANGRFLPGVAGAQRRGRPLGSKNKKTLLREELERDGSELVQLIKTKVRVGRINVPLTVVYAT